MTPRTSPIEKSSRALRIGFFARIAPEKGLLNLVQAVQRLHESGIEVELQAGGYLGKAHHRYMKQITEESAFLGKRFRYIGSPVSRKEKLEFMKSLDVFSVPARFHEPKGLYLLEAMSQGVPVVQPARGSYPELIESTGGGLLFEPDNIDEYVRALKQLLESPEQRNQMGSDAQRAVREKHSSLHAAQRLCEICRNFTNGTRGS